MEYIMIADTRVQILKLAAEILGNKYICNPAKNKKYPSSDEIIKLATELSKFVTCYDAHSKSIDFKPIVAEAEEYVYQSKEPMKDLIKGMVNKK